LDQDSVVIDVSRLGEAEYVEGIYRARQLRDAAAYGLGVGQKEDLPSEKILVETAALEGDLSAYVKAAWPVLEPTSEFYPNWHLDAIFEHLEAVTAGEITRLLINIPPRCTKSLSVSVFWMTWEWARRPSTKWLFLTHAVDLCIRDSVKCRRLIMSNWYQERWGHIFQLAQDQSAKQHFDNNRMGSRVSQTMLLSRGKGGDRIVIDDPHNTTTAESETQRNTTIRNYKEEVTHRLDDPTRGAKIIMMQRLHQKDLAGYVLDVSDDGEWEHLMLPMRYDPMRSCVTSLGIQDPRKKEREQLWPSRMPLDSKAMREIERDLGPYGVAGQWQQDPTAREGGQFERAWFQLKYKEVPRGSTMLWVRWWDLAGTEGGGAYTCGCLMGIRVTDGLVFVKHVVRGQWGAADRNDQILATAQNDAMMFGVPTAGNGEIVPNKFIVENWVEQEPGSGGKDQAKNVVRILAGYRVFKKTSSGDKFHRADPFAGAAKNKDIHVLPGIWRESFLDEMEAAGPGAAYLDQMDAAAAAYNRLMELYDQRRMTSLAGIDMSTFDDDDLVRESPWKGIT
jgi:hypothetical protein